MRYRIVEHHRGEHIRYIPQQSFCLFYWEPILRGSYISMGEARGAIEWAKLEHAREKKDSYRKVHRV